MPFTLAHVRSEQAVPMQALQELAQAQFSATIDNVGLLTVTQPPPGSEITIVIQQGDDGHNIKRRTITVAFGVEQGARSFLHASVCTEDILGGITHQTFTQLHDLNKEVLVTTPLAMLIKAASYAQKREISTRQQKEGSEYSTSTAPQA
jgi:hypothetical protein